MAGITHRIRCWRLHREVGERSGLLDSAAELVSRDDVERARRLVFEAEDTIPSKPGPNGDNVTITERGTSAEYLRRRLKRDRPDLRATVRRASDTSRRPQVRLSSGPHPECLGMPSRRISGYPDAREKGSPGGRMPGRLAGRETGPPGKRMPGREGGRMPGEPAGRIARLTG